MIELTEKNLLMTLVFFFSLLLFDFSIPGSKQKTFCNVILSSTLFIMRESKNVVDTGFLLLFSLRAQTLRGKRSFCSAKVELRKIAQRYLQSR